MSEMVRFRSVAFERFKAFRSLRLSIGPMNILVGPNNAGKSTILAAFRILSAALRRANARKPSFVSGPFGRTQGYEVDMQAASVAEENIFHNYDDSAPASVTFTISNGNTLMLYFPARSTCFLIADAKGKKPQSPKSFRDSFNCAIGFVPLLGPVEHNEPLFERDAARQALYNYRSARNFRNIWHHFPEEFEAFRSLLIETWPGLDIERPIVDLSHERPRLHMFCSEERIPRELFWSGFGFQVWCQMLTHIVQSRDASLFLIDEPDIYLHSDLQRQLLELLRSLGPDILIATHSTELIADAEAEEIVLVNRGRSPRRLRRPSDVESAFLALGSNLNPTLTQLARTRRVLFVEGKDFSILGRFARQLAKPAIANRSAFAVVPIDGFAPDRARSMKNGIELAVGGRVMCAIILDRDFRSDAEIEFVQRSCEDFADLVHIHEYKELENSLLVPSAIDRAAAARLEERNARLGKNMSYNECVSDVLRAYAETTRAHTISRYQANYRRFTRQSGSPLSDEDILAAGYLEAERLLKNPTVLIPGKDALTAINSRLQEQYGVNVTPSGIQSAMRRDEVPDGIVSLISSLAAFSETSGDD